MVSDHQASGGVPSEQRAYSGFPSPWPRLPEDPQPTGRCGLLTSQADEAPPWGPHSSALSLLLCGLQFPLWCTERLLVCEIPGPGTELRPLHPRFSPAPSWCWEWMTRPWSRLELPLKLPDTLPFVRFLMPNTRTQPRHTIGSLFRHRQDGRSQGQFLPTSLPEPRGNLPGEAGGSAGWVPPAHTEGELQVSGRHLLFRSKPGRETEGACWLTQRPRHRPQPSSWLKSLPVALGSPFLVPTEIIRRVRRRTCPPAPLTHLQVSLPGLRAPGGEGPLPPERAGGRVLLPGRQPG